MVTIDDVNVILQDTIECDGSVCYMNNTQMPGYEINKASSYASDLNECVLGVNDCHPESTTCINLNGTFTCQCRQGWRAYSIPKMCEDIDECKESINCTSPNTACINQPGTFTCTCQDGHIGDQFSELGCINICNSNPCRHGGICTAVKNGFSCLCPSGYTGLTCAQNDPEVQKLKLISIIVGAVAGLLLIALCVSLIVVCCKKKKVHVPPPREEDIDDLLWSSGYKPGMLRATLHHRDDFEGLELEEHNDNMGIFTIDDNLEDDDIQYQPFPLFNGDGAHGNSDDFPRVNGTSQSRLGTEYF
ncbi:uncharacterized protein LOC102800804 [Saccoglossus kowalevskii]